MYQFPFLIVIILLIALKRADSGTSSTSTLANKRKISSVASEISSDHGADGGGVSPAPEDSPRVLEEKRDPMAEEMAKFDIPDPDEADLETNMPWLKVISRLINSFNFYCTHQGFCHPNCYRRQMRATKRIMEATRHVSDFSSKYKIIQMIKSVHQNEYLHDMNLFILAFSIVLYLHYCIRIFSIPRKEINIK